MISLTLIHSYVYYVLNQICTLQITTKHDVKILQEILQSGELPRLETVHSYITLRPNQGFFKNGKLKLRCVASMLTVYLKADEIEIEEDPHQQPLVMIPTTYNHGGNTKKYVVRRKTA